MTFACDFYLPNFTSEIICLITFLEFSNFIYVTSKLSISFNHAEFVKKLASYYMLSPIIQSFIYYKSFLSWIFISFFI